MTVRDIDLGYRDLMKRVFAVGVPKVAVGIFEADGARPAGDGITLIEVAVINEFGHGVPPRSFIRAWFDENQEQCRAALMAMVQAAIKGDGNVKQAVERFGLWMQAQIQKRIAEGIPPANAPSTIAKKGSSKPLINTGQLRSAVTFAVDWGGGELTPVKSQATKNHEEAVKKHARDVRKAERRAQSNKRKERKQAVRYFKKTFRGR